MFKASSFKQIALLPDVSDGTAALQNAYVQTFGRPEASSTFALRFVGVSETGFKTGPRFAVALCLRLTEDAAGDGDKEEAAHSSEIEEAGEDGGLHVA